MIAQMWLAQAISSVLFGPDITNAVMIVGC